MRKLTHAGGIVYKQDRDAVLYLLVGPKKDTETTANEWIFPKGHIEQGEAPSQTAAREVEEETGVRGHLICAVGTVEFKYKRRQVAVQYFLIKTESESGKSDGRRMKWVSFEEALSSLTHPENKLLLRQSESSRTRQQRAAR